MPSTYAGLFQAELRALSGAALIGATVVVKEAGTDDDAELFQDRDYDTTLGNPLPSSVGLLMPGIDAGGNITFYADALLDYDVQVTYNGQIIAPFRARLVGDVREPPVAGSVTTAMIAAEGLAQSVVTGLVTKLAEIDALDVELANEIAARVAADAVEFGQFADRIGVGRLQATSGSPTSAAVNNMPVWRLDDGTSNSVGASTLIPPVGVDRIDVDLVWTQQTTGAGQVNLSLNAREYDAGTDLTAGSTSWFASSVVANGTGHLVEITRLATSKPVTPGKQLDLRLTRSGANASDTLSGNMNVIALIVRSPFVGPGAVFVPSTYVELN